MTPLRRNAIIKAGPAADIPGPTSTKIAPPIIEATPIIIACERERLRTSPVELDSTLISNRLRLYLNKSVILTPMSYLIAVKPVNSLRVISNFYEN